MVELLCFIGVFALFGVVAFIAWGVVKIYDIIHTKRWEHAKDTDSHLLMLIERKNAAWKHYLDASNAFWKVKRKIDGLLDMDTHKYLIKAEIDAMIAEAEALKPKYHELRKIYHEKHTLHDKAQAKFLSYCEEKGYSPWGK